MINLLTVVCLKDLFLLPLHLESCERFIQHPVHHWIVINEENNITDDVRNIIKKYKIKNRYTILHRNIFYAKYRHVFLERGGWESQQLIKLAAASIIKENYYIVDCKIFFCKDTDLENLNIVGSGLYTPRNAESHWEPIDRYYAKYFGLEPADPIMRNQAFFKILHEPLIDFEAHTPFDQALWPNQSFVDDYPNAAYPAEYMFYFNLARTSLNINKYTDAGYMLWCIDTFDCNGFNLLRNASPTCAFVHWNQANSLTVNEVDNLNGFLLSIDLSYKFKIDK